MGVGQRLAVLAKAAGYENLSDFARAAGVEPGTMRQQIRRESVPTDYVPKYIHTARGTGATADWLISGRGAPPRNVERISERPESDTTSMDMEMSQGVSLSSVPKRRGAIGGDAQDQPGLPMWSTHRNLPIYSTSEGDGGVMMLSPKPVDHEFRPYFATPDAYRVKMSTDDMSPAYERGDSLLILPSNPVYEGRDILLLSGDGSDGRPRACRVRRLLEITDTHWVCQQWNPERKERFSRKEWPIAHWIESKRNR